MEQLRKAAQDDLTIDQKINRRRCQQLLDELLEEVRREAYDEGREAGLRSAALAASQPAEIAPHGPVNPLEYSPCRDYVPAPDLPPFAQEGSWKLGYAAGLAAKRTTLEAALKASDAMLNEYIEKVRVLEAKRAPMTEDDAETLLSEHGTIWYDNEGNHEPVLTLKIAIAAILEASSGIPLAQAREMALGCVPPEAPINDRGTHIIWNDCRKATTEAIEAAFKEPK